MNNCPYHNVIFDSKYGYWEYKNGNIVIFDISTIPTLITNNHEVHIRKTTDDENQEIFEIMNGLKQN